MAQLSDAYLLAERVAEARPLAERALILFTEHHECGLQALTLRLLGAIIAHHAAPAVGADSRRSKR